MKEYVYLIQRTDHDDHKDNRGRTAAVSVHKTLASANDAARSHMEQQMRKSDLGPEVHNEGLASDGCFACKVQTFEDRRDHFIVQVQKMLLHGNSIAAAPSRRAGNENTANNAGRGEVIVLE